MAKFLDDVRTLSADPRYMGVVFSGSMKNALRQARKAPDHGLDPQVWTLNMSRDRYKLLQHLNLLPRVPRGNTLLPVAAIDKLLMAKLERKPPARAPSPYSLEYAMQRWPENFKS